VHPDRAPEDEFEQSTRKFQALGKIYEVLSDDDRRAIYDEDGKLECWNSTHWLPYRQDGTVDDELTSTVNN